MLEVHCIYGLENDSTIPQYCKYGIKIPGYHCVINKCDYVGYSYAPHEIAYANEKGEVDIGDDSSWVAFGGDMEPENLTENEILECKKMWREICRKKINEAYEDYMEKTGFQGFCAED